jgi:polyribonucleotide nucleotidyltransferase
MAVDAHAQGRRMDELEQCVDSLEHRLVTRDVLDGEIRSLERRLREVRELTEGLGAKLTSSFVDIRLESE